MSITSGVYDPDDDECAETSNHCVLIVGYDSEGDTPYWIVKNRFNLFREYNSLKLG